MFDPLYAGVVTFENVKQWEIVSSNKKREIIHAIIILQKKLHAVLLEPYTNDEPLMIDRLKFLCGIQPRFMSKVEIYFAIDKGIEIKTSTPEKYYMIYIPFTMEKTSLTSLRECKDVKIKFHPDNPLRNGNFVKNISVEICKILIFWFIAGVAKISEDMIFVRDGKLLTHEKTLKGNKRFKKELLEKYMHDDKIVKEAQMQVTENIDMDYVRGIVCGVRQIERDIRQAKNLSLSLDYKQYLADFEMRYEFAANVEPDELRKKMLCLDGEFL